MMTLLAATRLIPREPARVEMRNKRPLGKDKRVGERGQLGLKNALRKHLHFKYQQWKNLIVVLCCLK